MATRPGGLRPNGFLKYVLIASLAVAGAVIVYAVARIAEPAFSNLSGPVQLAILAAAIAAVVAEARWLIRDRDAHQRDQSAAPPPAVQNAAPIEFDSSAAIATALEIFDSMLTIDRDERARVQSSTERATGEVRAALAERSTQITYALGQVANMFVRVAEHLDESSRHTMELKEIVARLSLTPPAPPPRPEPSRVIGGTVIASAPADDDHVISLVDEERAEAEEAARAATPEDAPSEMLCRHHDLWIGDVEVIDTTGTNGSVRYWLRRKSDGFIYPRAFDADDIRLPEESSH